VCWKSTSSSSVLRLRLSWFVSEWM
jgi:hypothetical protein